MNMPDTPNPFPLGWETLTYISHLSVTSPLGFLYLGQMNFQKRLSSSPTATSCVGGPRARCPVPRHLLI